MDAFLDSVRSDPATLETAKQALVDTGILKGSDIATLGEELLQGVINLGGDTDEEIGEDEKEEGEDDSAPEQ